MISIENNIGWTNRTALVDVVVEIVPNLLQLLADAGFRIVGSERSRPEYEGTIRIRIAGSALPAECGEAEHLVNLTFEVETYGSQRITRIREVQLVGGPMRRGLHDCCHNPF